MLLWLLARSLWNWVTAGLASASFCWIARAASYDASASAGLPVSRSRMPMLLWLVARSLWNWVTAGLASASLCWIARAAWYDASASAGLPVSLQQDADVVVAARQVALELGDGGVGAGQALQQRSRFLVRRPRLVRPPGRPSGDRPGRSGCGRPRPSPRRRPPPLRPAPGAPPAPAGGRRSPAPSRRSCPPARPSRRTPAPAPAASPVGLARELASQPLVELGRVLEQPVAQRLELVFLSRTSSLTPVWNVLIASSARSNRACTCSLAGQVGVGLRAGRR